jgi:hypothetical protein
MRTERNPARTEDQGLPAAGDAGGGAAGPGSPVRLGAGLRALLVVAHVALLGFAVGSWAGPIADEAPPEAAVPGAGGDDACAQGLPPGHPPIETMMRLPPGHPPVRLAPRLPAGHPPIPSAPLPARSRPLPPAFTI